LRIFRNNVRMEVKVVIKVSMIIDKNDLQKKSREDLFKVFCQCLDEVAANAEAIEIDFAPLGTNKKFYRTSEVAEAFQVSDRMVRKWCESGKVKALHTPGGEWRIPASQFADLEKVKGFQTTVEKINERFKDFPIIEDYETKYRYR
jgi:excisionase family DNA binding protein